MNKPIKMAVIGVGRIGVFHAKHVQEIARETGKCELVAVVDTYSDTAQRVAQELQTDQEAKIHAFNSVQDLAQADLIDGAFIASRTDAHEPDARNLIDAGCRVLLEKPLTHSLDSAQAFVNYLDADEGRSQALMQAFMRRFDAPLMKVKELLEQKVIGKIFKITSILEDPAPPPVGYSSPGLLTDMSVHNCDEILWLLDGPLPEYAAAFGSNLHNTFVSPVEEDYDDAYLQMWFPGNLIGQVQVSRNHVAGYRNESWVFGDKGVIHIGNFQEDPLSVTVEAYSPKGVIAKEIFALRDYGDDVPVFIKRFGEAYKNELTFFLDKCLNDAPFGVTHKDGLNAMRVALAGAEAIRPKENGLKINY
ncbi:MAG: Gfo/Idh/MocA family oxidoreductase [Candidatus Latescibacteria bacterium]|jgi:myo-inositol 2-dehydrogenase / D-chiro-inositol 1-dehydrogenase|nr:Gfo/Idh/MocA family oxidoreductase [Candidatus Latescibacterota bacterium]